MTLRERFRRLTLWNKVGFLGGAASLLAVPLTVALWYWPRHAQVGFVPIEPSPIGPHPAPRQAFEFSVLPGFEVRPDGNVYVDLMLVNDSKPPAELHNFEGEFWIDGSFVLESSRRPDRMNRTRAGKLLPFLYYDFTIPLLHKRTAATLAGWLVRRPQPGQAFPVSYRAVCSEHEWTSHSWALINEKGNIRLVSR